MSNREAALDALQTIINLTSTHIGSKVNDQIIAQSAIIERALKVLHEPPVTSEIHIVCHYAPGRSIPATEAAAWYASGDTACLNCGGRCQ